MRGLPSLDDKEILYSFKSFIQEIQSNLDYKVFRERFLIRMNERRAGLENYIFEISSKYQDEW
ncbi:hypothetical protein HYW76_00070 [Candidatus Pacearchaeota archaeon]|nr:hypothetical protein [Candidatus Pacearchaeota archaeon]